MLIKKRFIAQIVTDRTPSAGVVSALGTVDIPIYQMRSDAPSISSNTVDSTGTDTGLTWLAQYVEEPGECEGFCLYSNEGGTYPDDYNRALSRLIAIAPYAKIFDVSGAPGQSYYFRLMSSAGYYLVSSSPIAVPQSSFSMEARTPSGSNLGSFGMIVDVIKYSSGRYSFYTRPSFIVDTFENGLISSTISRFFIITAMGSSAISSSQIHNKYSIERKTVAISVFVEFFNMVPSPSPTPGGDDPYSPGGTTGPGGGIGTHDPGSSDPIGFNMLPEVSAVGTGFLSLWSPTEQQMLDLSEYMWNANPLTLDFWRRLIADPIQLIYGLNIIPLSLYDAGLIGGTESVVVGMINTGIKMDYLTSQWVELDCGTIDIEETWGAYLDYDPYTKLDIYLPYIGYRPLRVDDFMPGVIHVKYKIDLLTGACCAQISSTKSDEHGDTLDSVIYQFTGNCATQIPVTATQYADAVRSAISLAAAIGTVALLAGSGASAAGTAGASIMPGVDPVGLLNSPGMVPVDSELFGAMSQYNFMTASSEAGAVLKSAGGTLKNVGMIHAGASAVENVMGIKPSVQRSGAIGGAAGMLGTQTPYLIFTRPRQAVPENQSTYTGYPSFMTKQLSELTGFTQIQSIHLEGIPCTANELAEIDALLKSGVIF